MEQVILVNEKDEATGTMEKMEAHRKGLLHRAFSVFIFNSKGEMLLQQRSYKKYHSGGLWTNACCSHPRPDETTLAAAERRLQEEMGITTPLNELFHFIYKARFDNGLTEHELDHVLIGNYDGKISVDKNEVADYCFKSTEKIQQALQTNANDYTVWFAIAFPLLLKEMKK
ncbi:MAG TPA: isopentenyl-diphosphate Delta-isomerase [Chitinophagaceae bacterium]|nr:isopentenyl-diphosphate Delta-isomerase [Chitinophagaceae bacterium]